MTQSLFHRLGAQQFIADDTDETTLASLDPGRDILLAVLKAAINHELGPRWADAAADTPLSGASAPVMSSHPFIPTSAALGQVRVEFPALFCDRVRSDWSQHSLERDKRVTQWGIHYILGPLSAAGHRKIASVLSAAEAVMRRTVRTGGHAAYSAAPNGEPELVLCWQEGSAGFSALRLMSSQYGEAGIGESETSYYAASVTLETDELDHPREDGSPDLAEVHLTLGVGNGSEVLPDVIQARTDVPYFDP